VTSAAGQLRSYVESTAWGRAILRRTGDMPSGGAFFSGALGVTVGFFGAVTNVVFVAIFAVFLAAHPTIYRRGCIALIPPSHRPRADESLARLAYTLRWWLLGQLTAMAALGSLAAIGLYSIGVSLWLPLALLTALLNFVPYIGPLIAAVPDIAVSYSQGPQTALYAAGLFFALQSIEGYFLTPMVQQRAVSLPPAVTLSSQLIMGVLAGPLGVMIATPFAAVTLVGVRMIYVQDVLGDRSRAEEDRSSAKAHDAA
jgi:predicted PurR-regulated permease PerM